MIAPLAKFLDWSLIQAMSLLGNSQTSRSEEALQFLKRPGFLSAESEPAQVEFNPEKSGARPCEFAANNVVYGRLYRYAERWQERPVIVLIHGGMDFPIIGSCCH